MANRSGPALTTMALSPFGVEVSGLNMSSCRLEDAAVLLSALAQYQLVVLRRQVVSPAEQLRLTEMLGIPEPGISKRPEGHQVPGYPNILYLSNEPGSPTVGYGAAWHSDGLAYARVPHGITVLHCLSCPNGVGDTLFANQYSAYEAMPDELRREIGRRLWYLPTIAFSEVPPGRELVQPMLRTHTRTGREFVFCSPSANRVRGLGSAAGRELLDVVHEYQVRDEYVYRHCWFPGDVVLWENCTLLHNRADVVDYQLHGLRAMHRSATCGSYEATECAVEEV